jgi:hypothetical protein
LFLAPAFFLTHNWQLFLLLSEFSQPAFPFNCFPDKMAIYRLKKKVNFFIKPAFWLNGSGWNHFHDLTLGSNVCRIEFHQRRTGFSSSYSSWGPVFFPTPWPQSLSRWSLKAWREMP